MIDTVWTPVSPLWHCWFDGYNTEIA